MPRKPPSNHDLFAERPVPDSLPVDRKPSNVVTSIDALARDPNLRRIKVDGKAVATLRASAIESLKIRVGVRWRDSLAKQVERALASEAARSKLMLMLSKRSLSCKHASDRLRTAGHAEPVIKQVIADAVRDGWLDDRALAGEIVRETTARAPAGKRLIEQKLTTRGLTDEVSKAAVANRDSARDFQDDLKGAWALARRKIASMGSLKPDTALRRVAGLLNRRGFDEEVIEATIDRLRPLLNSK